MSPHVVTEFVSLACGGWGSTYVLTLIPHTMSNDYDLEATELLETYGTRLCSSLYPIGRLELDTQISS